MSLASVSLLLLLSPYLITGQLVGSPPSCVSYRWDNQPVPKAVYKCELFSDFLEISATSASMTTQYFGAVKHVQNLRFVSNPSEVLVDFPSLQSVGTLEISRNPKLQYLRLKSLEKAESIVLQNLTNLITVDLNSLQYAKTFDFQRNGDQNLSLPVLTGVEKMTVADNGPLQDLRFPALTRASTISVQRNFLVKQVYAPNLVTVDNTLMVQDNNNLYSVHVPQLRTIGYFLSVQANGRLSNINLPELQSSSQSERLAISINSNPVLGRISIPQLSQLSNIDKHGLEVLDNPQLTGVDMEQLKFVGGLNLQRNPYLYFPSFDALEVVSFSFELEAQFIQKLDGFPQLHLLPAATTFLGVPQICCSAAQGFLNRIGATSQVFQCKQGC